MTELELYFSPLEEAIAASHFDRAVPAMVDRAVADLSAFGAIASVLSWLTIKPTVTPE